MTSQNKITNGLSANEPEFLITRIQRAQKESFTESLENGYSWFESNLIATRKVCEDFCKKFKDLKPRRQVPIARMKKLKNMWADKKELTNLKDELEKRFKEVIDTEFASGDDEKMFSASKHKAIEGMKKICRDFIKIHS